MGGHGILEELKQLRKEIKIVTSKYEGSARQIDEHQKQIVSLEGRVGRLTQSSEGYLLIRRRFLDVYKRDIKTMKELKGSGAIRRGNLIAHQGDALGDAMVYDRDHRTDASLYRELYGLDYNQVLDFRTYTDGSFNTSCQKLTIRIESASDDGALFLVLNAHATTVAQGKPLPDDLKVAFNSFLAEIEEYWLQPPAKEPNSPLGSAYYTFWKEFNQHALV